jgi:hypothetical protein
LTILPHTFLRACLSGVNEVPKSDQYFEILEKQLNDLVCLAESPREHGAELGLPDAMQALAEVASIRVKLRRLAEDCSGFADQIELGLTDATSVSAAEAANELANRFRNLKQRAETAEERQLQRQIIAMLETERLRIASLDSTAVQRLLDTESQILANYAANLPSIRRMQMEITIRVCRERLAAGD